MTAEGVWCGSVPSECVCSVTGDWSSQQNGWGGR